MIKELDDELYETTKTWWESLGEPCFPRAMIPRNAYVLVNGKPVVAGMFYKDDSTGFGFLGWVISNPDTTREERRESLEELLIFLFNKAKSEGVTALLTFMKHDYLVERLKNHGFIELSNGTLLKVF